MTPAQRAADAVHRWGQGYEDGQQFIVAGRTVPAMQLAQWIARHPWLVSIVLDHRRAFERRWEK